MIARYERQTIGHHSRLWRPRQHDVRGHRARAELFTDLFDEFRLWPATSARSLSRPQKNSRAYAVKEHRVIKIDLRQFGGSALTSEIDVPKDRNESQMSSDIPITYVPARNTIFLSYALAWAEVLNCDDVFIGVNALDYSGYPDCRPEFIESFQTTARRGTKRTNFTVHAPLIRLTKAQIIQRGVELGVDYAMTHSCYDPDPQGRACGRCDSCLLRKKGFVEAGVPDPTRYVW